jgi:hypothetical protein
MQVQLTFQDNPNGPTMQLMIWYINSGGIANKQIGNAPTWKFMTAQRAWGGSVQPGNGGQGTWNLIDGASPTVQGEISGLPIPFPAASGSLRSRLAANRCR